MASWTDGRRDDLRRSRVRARLTAAGGSVAAGLLAVGAVALPAAAAEGDPAPLLCPDDVVPAAGFADVDPGSVHAPAIDCLTYWEVVAGTGAGTFRPAASLTRGQLATIMVRVADQIAGTPLPAGADRFTDDDGSPHEDAIDALAAAGIVQGRTADSFQPNAPVTRGQIATMLVRSYESTFGALPEAEDHFADDDESVHEANIDKAVELGIFAGTATGTAAPDDAVRRDQASTLVARALERLFLISIGRP